MRKMKERNKIMLKRLREEESRFDAAGGRQKKSREAYRKVYCCALAFFRPVLERNLLCVFCERTK